MSKMKKIDISEMSLYQISSLKQQLDNEYELLETSIYELVQAKNKFAGCIDSCEKFEKVPNDSKIMVSLTSSVYVPGKVVDNDKFLIDIGTGYYVEMDRKSSMDYFNRKVKFLNEQIEKYTKMLHEKLELRQTLLDLLQQKQPNPPPTSQPA